MTNADNQKPEKPKRMVIDEYGSPETVRRFTEQVEKDFTRNRVPGEVLAKALMGEMRTTKEDAEKVYRLYRDDPDSGRSSYLQDHYRHGREGIMEPDRQALLAHAAWRAGRDNVKAESSN